jgi:hypothetical protein
MTFAYTLGPRRRLVLGARQAPARVCVPIPPQVYDTLAALDERAQAVMLEVLAEVLRRLVEGEQPPAPLVPQDQPEGKAEGQEDT